MSLLSMGEGILMDRLYGIGTPFDSKHSYIAVGDGSQSFSKSQTNLQGDNQFRKKVAEGYPIHTEGTNSIEFKSIFGSLDANFYWKEWAIVNSPTEGNLLNRVVEDNGEKKDDEIWEFSVKITLVG